MTRASAASVSSEATNTSPLYASYPTLHLRRERGLPARLRRLRRSTSAHSSIPRATAIHSPAGCMVATADCVGPRADGERMNQKLLPFIRTEALAVGTVTRRTLASRHDMVYRNVYLRKAWNSHRRDERWLLGCGRGESPPSPDYPPRRCTDRNGLIRTY